MKLRIVLLLILIATILAFKFLPWYVLVGLAVVFVMSIKFLGKKLLLWIFSTPFRAYFEKFGEVLIPTPK